MPYPLKFFTYLFLFSVCTCIPHWSQTQEYSSSLQTFSVEDGLTARATKAIFQDDQGFIWTISYAEGSSDGQLDRFDGKEFRHFSLIINRPDWHTPIFTRVFEDSDQKLWVYRTFNPNIFKSKLDKRAMVTVFYAIHIFDPKTGSTLPLAEYLNYELPFESNSISTLMVGMNNEMLIGTTTGAIYELRKDQYVKKFQDEEYSLISQIIPVDDGHWVAFNDRIVKLDGQWSVANSFKSRTSMAINPIRGGLYNNRRQNLISPFQDQQGNFHYITYDSTTQNSKSLKRKHYINGVEQPAPGNLDFFAMSAKTGIRFALKRNEGEKQTFVALDKSGRILAEQPCDIGFVEASYFDKDENLWLSTNNGLVIIRLKKVLFKNYLNDLVTYLNHPFQTRGMVQLSDSILWVGGLGKLRQLNLKTGSSQTYDDLLLNRDLALIDSSIWISEEYAKIFQYDLRTEKLTTYLTVEEEKSGKGARQHWKFHQDRWGNLWGGSFTGLTLIDRENKSYAKVPNTGGLAALEGADIIDIHENDKGMWLATSNGVFLFDPREKVILKHYHEQAGGQDILPHNNIAHIYEDAEGDFWLASRGGGLIQWNPDNGDIRQFTTEDGLSSDVLYAVYEDHNQNLWLPSYYGINQFHKVNHNTSYYLKADGITHDEFNTISHYRGLDSTLYFGGINGLNAFNPKDFSQSLGAEPAPLVITGLSKQDRATGELIDIINSFETSNQLTLNPSEVGFYLSFRLLDYSLSKEALYAYKIEGLDADWNYQSISNLRLNRLPYGNYTFMLKATAGRGIWTEPISFEISVVRPVYLRDWFIALCIMLASMAIYMFVYLRNRRLIRSERQLKEEVALRTQKIEKQSLELQQLDKAKSQFFANISHEFRTPLTLILGPLQQFMEDEQLSEAQRAKVERMHRNGMGLSELVEEILALSKLEAGKLEIEEQSVLVKPFLKRVFSAFESLAVRRQINYESQLHFSDQTMLNLDDGKLEKVINNLLSNAFKFTDEGGVIRLSAFLEFEKIRIRVEDSGKGIAAKDLPKIFDRYFQGQLGNLSDLQGGTGIGLALAKELTEAMGGQITVESKKNEGTTFQVTLPRKEIVAVPEHDPKKSKPEEAYAIRDVKEFVKNEKAEFEILVVEDNTDMRAFIVDILSVYYSVYQAENGKKALKLLQSNPADLIISDVMMPEMDGFTLLKLLKSNDLYRQIPMIMLTARAVHEDKLSALTLGVDDYLTKPFVAQELLARTKNLLAHAKARTAPPSSAASANKENLLSTIHETITSADDLIWIKQLEKEVLIKLNDVDFSMETIAALLGITDRQLQRKVKQITGLTPNKYVQELRLQLGRSYLEKQVYPTMQQVAAAVGFRSSSYFSRLFLERFGKKATDYVK